MALSNLESPSAVVSAIKEYDRLGREQFLKTYGFKSSREYLLRFDGREYDSKAIAGVAHKYEFPEHGPLSSDSFSGGISSGAAAKKLNSLGFEIVGVNQDASDWTLRECELTTEAYFDCLRRQLEARKTNKTAVYRDLANRLNGRTAKAVEYKFLNINAILMEEGLPTIGKPKGNYQNLLKVVARDFIRVHPQIFEVAPDSLPAVRPAEEVFVPPPSPKKGAGTKTGKQIGIRVLGLEGLSAENKKLGRGGEEWVISFEKRKLTDAGRADLAERVLWVSKDLGDGYGYDVESFTCSGETIMIEVKTTNGAATRPFFISEAELKVADREAQKYRLYRVFDFASEPKIFELVGPLRQRLSLEAISYRVASIE